MKTNSRTVSRDQLSWWLTRAVGTAFALLALAAGVGRVLGEGADLVAQKTAPASLHLGNGDWVTMDVSIINPSAVIANNVVAVDIPDQHFQFDAVLTQPPNTRVVTNLDGTVQIEADVINNGETLNFSLRWKVLVTGDARFFTLSNYFRITNSLPADPTPGNDFAMTLTEVTIDPPTITNEPVSLSRCAGQSATFSVTAGSVAPMSYQWFLNDTEVGGATSTALTLPSVTANDAGNYYLIVTNIGGAVTSQMATLTVNPLPIVSVNSEITCPAQSAVLTATHNASSPTYLWSPGGATVESITVSPGSTTTYTVTVTDGVTGCANSASGTVTVNPLPTVTVNNATICGSGSAVLTATTDAQSPTYSWSPGGETTASISVSSAGTYTVTVTDGVTGCANSASGTVTVAAAVTASVNSETVCAGSSATLTATTDASSPTYSWSPGGATTAAITVSPSATTTYTVTVTESTSGCSTTADGTVTVNPLPTPSVDSASICAGGSATLTATPGAANPSYLWSPGGDTTASITVSPTETTVYTVTVTDGDTGCSATAQGTVAIAALPVNWAVSGVATQTSTYFSGTAGAPVAGRANDGITDGAYGRGSVTHTALSPFDAVRIWEVDLLSVKAISRVKLWLRTDSSPERNTNLAMRVLDGSHAVVFAVTNVNMTPFSTPLAFNLPSVLNGRYVQVQSFGASGQPLSLAEVEVFSPFAGQVLAATQSPVDTTADEFSTVTLGPVAGAVTPDCSLPLQLDYQWQRSGVDIAGATGPTYTFVAGAADNTALYRAVLTVRGANPALPGATATTAAATLTVNPVAPVVVTPPVNTTVAALNGTATLSVTARGSGTLTYQWYRDDVQIPGATSSSYTLATPACDAGGNYYVVITNPQGSVQSATAVVTVRPSASVYFDFATVGQYTNNLPTTGNGGNTPITPVLFEAAGAGVGGGRGLDLLLNNGSVSDSGFPVMPYDFARSGNTLRATIMFKAKAPAANDTTAMLGFASKASRLDSGDEQVAFMGAKLRSTAQPALTYMMEFRNKLFAGTGVGSSNTTAATTLVAGNWYKMTVNFTNIKASVANCYAAGVTLQDMGFDGQVPGSTIINIANARILNADIVNDAAVFADFRTRENTGVDFMDNFGVWMNDGPVVFTCPPAPASVQTVLQGRSFTFKAYADGTPPYSYQWYRWSDAIPGATDWAYTLPAMAAEDDGTEFSVTVNGSLSSVVTLLYAGDAEPPVLVSAGSFDGLSIGVAFDEKVDPTSATTSGNYSIDGGPNVNFVSLRPDGKSVTLLMDGAVSGAFTLQVSGVSDLFGNAMGPVSASGTVASHLKSVEIGAPLPIGTVYSPKDGSFTITAGGADVWGNADQFRFTYEQKTGDFDVKVMIDGQTGRMWRRTSWTVTAATAGLPRHFSMA